SVVSGGKRCITVRDDGRGMTPDDALLAFEHHATSKIRSTEDLEAIATLGFRGEALPSIAAVSRLIMKTRAADAESVAGTGIEINGGIIRNVKSISWDKGTEIEIRDLFFNMPARKKFLRSNDTELGHIARLVTQYAIAHHEMRFTFESEGRTLLDTVAVSDLRERIYQIFGESCLASMLEFNGSLGSMKICGFGSRPREQRTNSYSQYIYVNRRMVRDKVVMSAVRKAYRGHIPNSTYPVVIIFLELPFNEVDVNAHPAKTEIRFRDQNSVHRLVQEAIEKALELNSSVPAFVHMKHTGEGPSYPNVYDASVPAVAMPLPNDDAARVERATSVRGHFQRSLGYSSHETRTGHPDYTADHASMPVVPDLLYGTPGDASNSFQTEGMRVIGQLHESYIIACDPQGLIIVDQHVAHERILYEQIARQMQRDAVETQGLLIPISLELTPAQKALLERMAPDLKRNGFHFEPFGGSSILIRSIPAITGQADARNLLLEILEGLESEERTLDIEKMRDRIAVKTACRAAVKVNTPLGLEKMQWLIDQLSLARIPLSCPHGRPIILRFTMNEIEKNFGR
ncbi:MAG TPA: DNA mismatch repair endonuclease MutL, partial [Acidobacteriota bacterium]|nr:DNA mismatch repair endonuclease MutL [Acidobacteriota bacterium]